LQALAKQCGDNNRELTELDKSIAHLKRMLIHDVELVIMNLCNETITQAQAQNDFCTANLKELLQSEGNVIVHMRDKHGQTPLIAAAMAHNPSVCRLLLDANADPLMVDNNGHNALFYALSRHENDEKRSVIPMLINSMIKQLALALDKDFIIKEVGSKDNFSGQIKAYELTHQANVMPTLIISLFEHKVPCKYIIALLLPPKFDDEFYDAIYDHIERRENPRECIKLCEAALYDNTHPFNYILTRQKKKFFRGDGGDALKKVLFLMEKTLSAHSQLFEQLNVDTIAFYSRNLSDAARNNDTTTLRNLIKLGIKVDFCDTARNNCTPLMDAVMKGHIGCVQQLVLQGASPALPLRGTKVQLLEIVKKALSGFRITDQLCAYLDAQAGEIVEISPQTYCAIIGSDRLLRCLNPVVLPVLDEPQETGVRRFGLYMDASQYNSRRNNDHILYDEFTTCDL